MSCKRTGFPFELFLLSVALDRETPGRELLGSIAQQQGPAVLSSKGSLLLLLDEAQVLLNVAILL